MKKTLSIFAALFLSLLVIAPSINYSIPLIVNSYHWVYLVVAMGLLGLLVWYLEIHPLLKALSLFLFVSCFFSQAPYLSFNAYVLVVFSIYLLFALRHCDFKIVLNFVEAAFWFQILLAVMQLMGRDKLLNFDRNDHVFLGTMLQYMRFASLLAVIAPFVILKNRLYIIPLSIACAISQSSTFAMSLFAGAMVYLLLTLREKKKLIMAMALVAVGAGIYAAYDWGSFRGAIIPSNGGRLLSWWALLQTWVLNTESSPAGPNLQGPFNLQWFLAGHGMDTFLPLFPIYKHDANPFPQAHNDWLQLLWETGIIGFSLVAGYAVSVWRKVKDPLIRAGMACIAVDMFFAFPMRLTQSMFLIVAFLAMAEQKAGFKYGRQ